MAITSTKIVIVNTGREYNIPGDKTADEIIRDYAASIDNIGNMDNAVTVEGEVKTITFSPRTGTKG